MTDPYNPATPADGDFVGSPTVGIQVHMRDVKTVLVNHKSRLDGIDTTLTSYGTRITNVENAFATGVIKNSVDTLQRSSDGVARFQFSNGGPTGFFSATGAFVWGAEAGTGNLFLTAGGDLTAAGNVTAYSDLRLKENLQVIESAVEKLARISGVSYNRIDVEGKPKQLGVVAQEVKHVFPELVFPVPGTENREGGQLLSVAYIGLIAPIIEAIKELSLEIEKLKGAR